MTDIMNVILFTIIIILPLACIAKACIQYLFNSKPKKEKEKDENNDK